MTHMQTEIFVTKYPLKILSRLSLCFPCCYVFSRCNYVASSKSEADCRVDVYGRAVNVPFGYINAILV